MRFSQRGDPFSIFDSGSMNVGYSLNPLKAHDYGGYSKSTEQKPNTFGKIVNPEITKQLVVNDVIQTPIKPTQITESRAVIGKPVAPTVNLYDGGNIQQAMK